jgi:hypothetical protein
MLLQPRWHLEGAQSYGPLARSPEQAACEPTACGSEVVSSGLMCPGVDILNRA